MFRRKAASPEESDNVATLFSGPKTPTTDQARHRFQVLLKTNQAVAGMTITPVLAEIMLESNTGNRNISAPTVERLAADMRNGDWRLTGEAIIFSSDGILNDGQHRLSACVLAGVSFVSDVRFGVARESFQFTDIGAKRSGRDVFDILGEANAPVLASALRLLNNYEAGTILSRSGATPHRLVEMLEIHPNMRESAARAMSSYREFRLIPPSTMAFCHYLFARLDKNAADRFFTDLGTGVGRKSDPVDVLRNMVINNGTKRRIIMPEIGALMVKAWNARRGGKTVTNMTWRTSGPAAEAFPVPR
jgi:hypothetical protein